MRLIDADALLEQYKLKDATKYGNKNAKQQAHSYDTLMMYEIADMIEDAPTAYDVEKVVEKLEYESEGYFMLSEMYDKGTVSLKTAVEIVRAGGKDQE